MRRRRARVHVWTGFEPRPALSASWRERATLAIVPDVSFYFADHPRSVSEEAAVFLVAQLELRSGTSETAAALAERIATEAHRGRFAPPGQDLLLVHEEQEELLETLKATINLWPEEDRVALHELQLAVLAVETNQADE
jgi:hypothetical protein